MLPRLTGLRPLTPSLYVKKIRPPLRLQARGAVCEETVVLRRWGAKTNVWFINSSDEGLTIESALESLYGGQFTNKHS